MSSSIDVIAQALADAISLIDGVRVLPYLPDDPTPPCALVNIETIDFHGTFGDSIDTSTFTVWLILNRASERSAIQELEQFMSSTGDKSIRQAIEADDTLDGVVQSVEVKKAGPPSPLTIGSGDVVYLAVPFTVDVVA